MTDLIAALEAIIAEVDGPDRPHSVDSYLPLHLIAQARIALDVAKAKVE